MPHAKESSKEALVETTNEKKIVKFFEDAENSSRSESGEEKSD
jgi:hypothetical protein